VKYTMTNSALIPAARPVAFAATALPQGIGVRGFVRSNADSAIRTWSPPV